MKILIIGPSWIGDMMISQSLYRTLKNKYPDALIDVMTVTWCKELLIRMSEINKILLMPLGHNILNIKKRWNIGYSLRSNKYDRSYILPNSFKSALIPFFANIPKRIGWRGEMRYGLINDIRILNKIAFPLMIHRYCALSYNKIDVKCSEDIPKPLLLPKIKVTKEEIAKIINIFNINTNKPIIGFCPGSEFGPAKCWPYYHYVTLAEILIKKGYQIILLGSIKDNLTGNKIYINIKKNMQYFCLNLIGKTRLEEAIIIIAYCKIIISNDSGLMHIAAALQKPLIALYGPSSPQFTPPLSHNAKIIRLIKGYQKIRKGNQNYGYHQSMINIHPQQVLEILIPLLTII
ncbi:ADP-heptose--LPS heptosyltransferase 2 [Serratia symbiotica]|nr:ADP-heptose--LPS heptosyltransferase 2 [Serratia symbiotica]